ncbi:S-layer homology domain-containing protein [Bacillus sp. AK128]
MKKLKSFIGLFIFVLVMGIHSGVSAQGSIFSDVSNEHWAKEEIEYLAMDRIINGFNDGTFRPQGDLKRVHIAHMMDRKFNYSYYLEGQIQDQGLVDVPKSDENYNVIQAVVQSGLFDEIIKDNKFEPYKTMTRAEMAYVLAKAFELEPKTTTMINDVPNNHWAKSSIQALIDHNLTVLYDGGNFKPDQSLTRAQFSAFMCRAVSEYFKPVKNQLVGENVLYWIGNNGVNATLGDTKETVNLYPYPVMDEVFVQGDWIYFIHQTEFYGYYGSIEKGHLYRIKKDGSSLEELSNEDVTSFTMNNGKLVYSVHYESMYSLNLDGSGKKAIKNTWSIQITSNQDWIFYSDLNGIHKMKADGSEFTTLTSDTVAYDGGILEVSNDAVLYINEEWGQIVMDTSGKVIQNIVNDVAVIDLIDDKVMYSRYNEETGAEELYVTNLAGNTEQISDNFNGYYMGHLNGFVYFDDNYYTDSILSFNIN